MLRERNIIRFDPFYFKNGNTAKPKYFLVLKHSKHNTVIASLPTRSNSIPQDEDIEEGCLEISEINLNCFVIPQNVEVTECGKRFDFKTYLYGHQLDDYSVELMNEIYPNEGSDYEVWGKMKQEMFNKLITCFKNSKTVKWKYRTQL
jgi:hypothetical protein